MRLVDLKIIYTGEKVLHASMRDAANVANIYVNADEVRQIEVHCGGEQEDAERFYCEQYPTADHTISAVIKIYREESGDSPIYYGTEIQVIQKKDQEVYYELDYAGKKISYRGIIPRMDWQNFLFEKWQSVYGVK